MASIIATLSPALSNLEETISTLRFASRSRLVSNKAVGSKYETVRERIMCRTMNVEEIKKIYIEEKEKIKLTLNLILNTLSRENIKNTTINRIIMNYYTITKSQLQSIVPLSTLIFLEELDSTLDDHTLDELMANQNQGIFPLFRLETS